MAPLPWILVAAGAVALLLVAERRASIPGAFATKPVASAAFVALALDTGATGDPVGRWTLAALALCALGDVLLVPRSVAAFRVGILVFLAGHLAYVGAFLVASVEPGRLALGAAIVVPASTGVAWWVLPRVAPALKGAVVAYCVVISGMVIAAMGTGEPGWILPAVAFYLSDVAIARHRFVAPAFVNRLVGLPLYYGAQLTFAALAG